MSEAISIFTRVQNKLQSRWNEFDVHDRAIILSACIIAESISNSMEDTTCEVKK